MRTSRFSTLWLLFFCAAPLLSAGARPDARAAVRALDARYRRAATLEASFLEIFRDSNGGVASESGTVYFSRPGRMRWEYESPEQKLFLVDGKNVWFYVPADQTASRAKLKESSDWRTPLALLAGKADLGKLCASIETLDANSAGRGQPENKALAAGDTVLRCTPRDGSGHSGSASQGVLLETDQDAHLVRVVIHDPGGTETDFRFGNWEENIPIAESKFHFEPPPGVSIVDEESLAGEMH